MADEAAGEDVVDLRKWRLPRGRHGLPRELVTRSQRERLLAAVVRATVEHGYEATTVGDILGEAGVGRESFYELFADKRECMLIAHTILVDDLEQKVRAVYLQPGAWVDRVRGALATTLDWFAGDPTAARFIMIELAAVGPESRARFQHDFNRFVVLLDEGLDQEGSDPAVARATSLAVGAALARVYEDVLLDRAAQLSELLPELTYELLVPFLGEEEARAGARRAEVSPQ
jgi:AcrR family transcriptional regulator